jgi:hypothetical protein
VAEISTSSTETTLDFVTNEQDILLFAQLGNFFQVTLWWRNNAAKEVSVKKEGRPIVN